MRTKIAHRIACAMFCLILSYPCSYAVFRLAGSLTRYDYGLYLTSEEGFLVFEARMEIRSSRWWESQTSDDTRSPTSAFDSFYQPWILFELWVRGFGGNPRRTKVRSPHKSKRAGIRQIRLARTKLQN